MMLLMKTLNSVLLILTLFFAPSLVKAQGCSDAGFCTLGNLRLPAVSIDSSKHKLGLVLASGIGDEKVFVFTPALQYEYAMDRLWSLQAKLTTNYATGNLGAAGGPGDFYLSGMRNFNSPKDWRWSAMAGIKFPLSQSNLKENGKPLPMQYQSSLGTIDAILGLSVINKKWHFSAGYQQPLSGSNSNGFLPIYWQDNSDAAKYPSTSNLKRKADMLLRGTYQFVVNKKFQLSAGLLGIYHLGRDTYINTSVSNQPIAINGSDGLTLNLNASVKWALSKSIQIGFLTGTPLIARDIRPDGLTRSIVISPEVSWSF
jgi:hypothetical protein